MSHLFIAKQAIRLSENDLAELGMNIEDTTSIQPWIETYLFHLVRRERYYFRFGM